MVHELDDTDIKIISSLQQDGRKSFRQIARELGISTPTVQARYKRLVNIGLIKSISPVIDSTNLTRPQKKQIQIHASTQKPSDMNIEPGMSVKMTCALCNGQIGDTTHVLKFANFERFFCCVTCKAHYKEKNRKRIESVIKRIHEEN